MSLFKCAKVKFIEYFFSTKSSCCSFKCLILESYQSDPNMCSIIVLVAWCLNTVKCVSMTCKRALNLYFISSIFHTADWWHISANSILFICLLSSRRKFAHQISIDEWLTSSAVAVRWLPFIYTLKTGCQYKTEGLKTYLMHAQVRRNRSNESVDESEVISREVKHGVA